MFLDKSNIKSTLSLLCYLSSFFCCWKEFSCLDRARNYTSRNVASALLSPNTSAHYISLPLFLDPLLLFHDHQYVSPLHAQPQYTSVRNKRSERAWTPSEKWIPSSDVGGRGMAHVTLGFRVFWCAFFGIMIGHFQVWLDMLLSSPFPIPPTDPVTHVLPPSSAKLPLRTLSC